MSNKGVCVVRMRWVLVALFACCCAVSLAGCPSATRLALARAEALEEQAEEEKANQAAEATASQTEEQVSHQTTELWVSFSGEAARKKELGAREGIHAVDASDGQVRSKRDLGASAAARKPLAKTSDGVGLGVSLLAAFVGTALLVAARERSSKGLSQTNKKALSHNGSTVKPQLGGLKPEGLVSLLAVFRRSVARGHRVACIVLACCLAVDFALPVNADAASRWPAVLFAHGVGATMWHQAGLLAGDDELAGPTDPADPSSAAGPPDAVGPSDSSCDLVIVFGANGGEGSMRRMGLRPDNTVDLPPVMFTHGDNAFVGWDVMVNGDSLPEVVPDAREGDVIRAANKAFVREGVLDCTVVRDNKKVRDLQLDLGDVALDGVVTLVAVWGRPSEEFGGQEDAGGEKGPAEDASAQGAEGDPRSEDSDANDPGEARPKVAEHDNTQPNNGGSGVGSPDARPDASTPEPNGVPIDDSSCERDEGQNDKVAKELLDDVLAGTNALEDDVFAGKTRAITFVSHVPDCEDVCVEVPEGKGRVPQCPFQWERHRFVEWTAEGEQGPLHLVPGEELPRGDVALHARWKKQGPVGQVDGLDFSSCRLLVGSEEEPGFGEVLSNHEDVWLVGFDDAEDAAWAYVDHGNEVDFAAPDIEVSVAGQDGPTTIEDIVGQTLAPVQAPLPQAMTSGQAGTDDANGPVADLSRVDEVCEDERGSIALIDTGVNGYGSNVVRRLSVIDSFLFDSNGHGTSMLQTMMGIDPNARVVSIRALNDKGEGSAASVYAAIQVAIQMRCKVINLSLCAPAVAGNAAVEQAIRDAYACGITVVGAAGNEGRDARWYLPGRMDAEAVIVGSCNSTGTRGTSSNFGSTVDLYVPSASTSQASAKVSAWLCAHSTFGHELEDLDSDEARQVLGYVTEVEEGDSNDAPELDGEASFTAAWTHPTIYFEHHWANIGWATNSNNGKTYSGYVYSTYGSDANNSTVGVWAGGNPSYYKNRLEAIKISIVSGSSTSGTVSYAGHVENVGDTAWVSNGAVLGTVGQNLRLEAWKVRLEGDIAQLYYLDYKGWTHVPTNTSLDGIKSSNSDAQGWVGLRSTGAIQTSAAVCLRTRSFAQTVQVRYQNANGSWGSYSTVIDGNYATGSDISWSRAQDATYAAASVSYTVTSANTKQVSVARRTATNTIKVRYQNADGSWGSYSNASSGVDCVGYVRSWSRAQDATYKAASASITGTASNQTKSVDVARRTFSVAFNGNGSTGGSMGAQSFYVGQQKALNANAFAKKGHTFTGWNTAANGSGTSYANKANVKDLAAADKTATLYAQWRAHTYTVSFDANATDAQGQTAQVNATYGTGFKIPSCGFTRHLFTFVAWNTKPDGSGTWYQAGKQVSNLTDADGGRIVLYAQWNPKQMRVRVPAAIHFVAGSDGEMVGPDDGVARLENEGEVSVRVRVAQTELYAPDEDEVSFSLEEKTLDPGNSLGMSDLCGHTSNPLPEEREIGCIHWKFEAV